MNNRCDFCREEIVPPHAHTCADEYIARTGILQDGILKLKQANDAYHSDPSEANLSVLQKAFDALDDGMGGLKAKYFCERAELAIRVADAAAFHYIDGDDTPLEIAVVNWLEHKYKRDRPYDKRAALSEELRKCKDYLKQKHLYGDVARLPRPKMALTIKTLRELLEKMSGFLSDVVEERLEPAKFAADDLLVPVNLEKEE